MPTSIAYNCTEIYVSSSVGLNMYNMPRLSNFQVAVSAEFKSGQLQYKQLLFVQTKK